MMGAKKPDNEQYDLYDLAYRPFEFSDPIAELEKALKEDNQFKVRRCLNILFPELPIKKLQKKLEEARIKLKEYEKRLKGAMEHDLTGKDFLNREMESLKAVIERIERMLSEFEKLPKDKIQNLDISIINGIINNLVNSNQKDRDEWQTLLNLVVNQLNDKKANLVEEGITKNAKTNVKALNYLLNNILNAKQDKDADVWKNILLSITDQLDSGRLHLQRSEAEDKDINEFFINLSRFANQGDELSFKISGTFRTSDRILDQMMEGSDPRKDWEIYHFYESQVDSFANMMFNLSNSQQQDFNQGTEKEFQRILRLINLGDMVQNPKIGEEIWKAQNLAGKTQFPNFKAYYKKLLEMELRNTDREAEEQAEEERQAISRLRAKQYRMELRNEMEEVRRRRLSQRTVEEEEALEEELEEEELEEKERKEKEEMEEEDDKDKKEKPDGR